METLFVILGIIGPQELIVILFLTLIGIPLWLLPIFISKGKQNRLPIILITLLLGWTLLGWVGALIWSIMSPKEEANLTYVYICKKCGFKKGFEQELKMYKCPQCGEEN